MTQHIVKAYDEELKMLHSLIREMGELTLKQIQKAMRSLIERNEKIAHGVVDQDYKINHLEIKIDERAIRILALRQPVASDLRTVIAALKISNQIERIADYASNIAKRTLLLMDLSSSISLKELPSLTEKAERMFKNALEAFATHDVNLALRVWHMDQEIDKDYNAYLMQLFDAMIADPKNISPCTHLLFVAKNIERIGDQSSNIAEAVYTMVTGKPFKESNAALLEKKDEI